jgi:hypothetical protein
MSTLLKTSLIAVTVVSVVTYTTLLVAPKIKSSFSAAAVSSASSTLKHATTQWTFPVQSAKGSKDEIDGTSVDAKEIFSSEVGLKTLV